MKFQLRVALIYFFRFHGILTLPIIVQYANTLTSQLCDPSEF